MSKVLYVIDPCNYDSELQNELLTAIVPETAKKESQFGDFLEAMINEHGKEISEWFDIWQEEQIESMAYNDEAVGVTVWDEDYAAKIERREAV